MIKNLNEFKQAYWSKMSYKKTKRREFIRCICKAFPQYVKEYEEELKGK